MNFVSSIAPESRLASVKPADDFEQWRDQARRLFAGGISPAHVKWVGTDGQSDDLFAAPEFALDSLPQEPAPRVSRRFIDQARLVFLHSDNTRHALLYRLLWRLQDRPRLLDDSADDDVRQFEILHRAVRRDIHKMRAFVRFRAVEQPDGTDHFVAWFEPQHYILRANAAFFVNRFANMQWSILTPQGSLHWDGAVLREGPPACRADAPSGDPTEDLWRQYYASIFNPARLKINAMLKEMPKRYWKNMPEAALIPELVAGAQAREAAMVELGETSFPQERPETLKAISQGIAACRACPIGCNGTRAVSGEGPAGSRLMIVGEQPGDSEEEAGRPFVGPAGQVLDAGLERAGIDRKQAWVTNAVKHFKFQRTAKRRLHQNPSAKEIDTCRWWLDSERALVKPQHILALGASAARGILGKTVSIGKSRGQPIALADGATLWITAHPSYILRLDGEARQREEQKFAADLALVAREISGKG